MAINITKYWSVIRNFKTILSLNVVWSAMVYKNMTRRIRRDLCFEWCSCIPLQIPEQWETNVFEISGSQAVDLIVIVVADWLLMIIYSFFGGKLQDDIPVKWQPNLLQSSSGWRQPWPSIQIWPLTIHLRWITTWWLQPSISSNLVSDPNSNFFSNERISMQ